MEFHVKWLQWATIDLVNGVGGVENHARCMARELTKLGVQTFFSKDPKDFYREKWDVIHSHGSSISALEWVKLRRHRDKSQTMVFTNHGLTPTRMIACGELLWPGGYVATGRELVGTLFSDVVLSVNPSIQEFAKHFPAVTKMCPNAGDTGDAPGPKKLSFELEAKLKSMRPFWTVVGRYGDAMKGPERIPPILRALPALTLVACPGAGFENLTKVFQTGRQETSAQVLEIMKLSKGLLLTSTWETGPIVVLEALAHGVPVACTNVGYIPSLSSKIKGLEVLKVPTTAAFVEAIKRIPVENATEGERFERAQWNKNYLPTWQQSAKIAFEAVLDSRQKRTVRSP